MISDEEYFRLQYEYYNNISVLFEIVKVLKNRELSFIQPHDYDPSLRFRYFIALNVDYLIKHFNFLGIDRLRINLYHSVALLKDIPVFSYNLKERRQDPKYKEFNKNYRDHVIGYDLVFDIDIDEDFKKGYDQAKEIKKILDEYKVPYFITNSSIKGFHFCIDYKYFPEFEDLDLLLITFYNIIRNIKAIYEFDCLDDSIVDLKRLKKLPYSLVVDGSVCLPLSDKQFDEYNFDMVMANNVLKNIDLYQRGLLVRHWNLTEDELKDNVNRFIEDFK